MTPSSCACLSRRSRSRRSAAASRGASTGASSARNWRSPLVGCEGLRAREAVEQLGLAHQQLGEQLAAGAQAHQVREQLGLAREEIQVGGARARRRDEALELAERFVGVRALPERVEQHREEPGDRAARGGRIRDERPAFQDPAQVLARAVRIREAGGLERGVARDAHRRRGGRGRRREELAEGRCTRVVTRRWSATKRRAAAAGGRAMPMRRARRPSGTGSSGRVCVWNSWTIWRRCSTVRRYTRARPSSRPSAGGR